MLIDAVNFRAHVAVDIGGSLAKVVWFNSTATSSSTSLGVASTPSSAATAQLAGGGTASYSPLLNPIPSSSSSSSSNSSSNNIGRLMFKKFETSDILQCIEFIRQKTSGGAVVTAGSDTGCITLTGGGAHKFYTLFEKELGSGVKIRKEDEMECLISGLNFLVRQVPNEIFTYDEKRTDADKIMFEEVLGQCQEKQIYPYMLVNIGSGVSILKVMGENLYERISGTSLGGGTLWGLLSLLTNAASYDEMLELSKTGDNKRVDMLVGDIYGGDYSRIGLKATTIASSFGNVFKLPKEERSNISENDISASLLYLVSNNIGQIAYLNAKLHQIERIYFSGFFIRGHPVTMNTISYAINFWSRGEIRALFLRHEGYLGGVGAFIKSSTASSNTSPTTSTTTTTTTTTNALATSTTSSSAAATTPSSSNYTLSLDAVLPTTPVKLFMVENFSKVDKIVGSSLTTVGVLEALPSTLVPLPVLNHSTYRADTTILSNSTTREYWINLLDKNLGNLVELALEFHEHNGGNGSPLAPSPSSGNLSPEILDEMNSVGGVERDKQPAKRFEVMYRSHLQRLRQQPKSYGIFTIRSLLILREQCLREMGLADIFRDIKKTENEGALKALPLLLQSIDAIEDDRDRVLTLVENILAGNMYDWGSTSVMTMLKSGELDFATAKAKVKRPAKFDHSIQLADRLLLSLSHFSGAAYRKVVVFVDNSGADILLGIIPFVRFLVSRCGVQSLILAANSQPSVNDITAEELVGVMERLCEIDPESLGKAWRDGVIKVMASGSDSPCLDLMRIDESLALECRDVDLVIIEGMGRAIHTNFFAQFNKTDSLKIAVFKNSQVAQELNAEMYDAICLFQQENPARKD